MPPENIVEACIDFTAKFAEALENEGIDHCQYWIARMGLDEDTIFRAIYKAALVDASNPTGSKMIHFSAAFLNGIIVGYVYANREELLAE